MHDSLPFSQLQKNIFWQIKRNIFVLWFTDIEEKIMFSQVVCIKQNYVLSYIVNIIVCLVFIQNHFNLKVIENKCNYFCVMQGICMQSICNLRYFDKNKGNDQLVSLFLNNNFKKRRR